MDAPTRKTTRHWLNSQRLSIYPRLVFAIFLVTAIAWILLAKNLVDREGKPLGADFIQFWAASKLVLAGDATGAYNVQILFREEQVAVPGANTIIPWMYPPSFFLIVLPLGLLPYLWAWAAWEISTLTACVLVFRRLFSDARVRHAALWCLAGFPGLWVALAGGQNGFLTASLAAGALLALPRRPILAGVLIGLLTCKPHLALLFPIALLAARAWRALLSASLAAVAFLAAGTAVAGPAALKAFFASAPHASRYIESGAAPLSKIPTVFVLLRLLGVSVPIAYAVHALFAFAAVAALVSVWRRSPDWQLRAAALMTATFLVSPYLFDYDLVWLAFPIAWLALIGLRDGWLPGDREILVAAWMLPFLVAPVAKIFLVQPGPFVLAALLWTIVRRVPRAESLPPPVAFAA